MGTGWVCGCATGRSAKVSKVGTNFNGRRVRAWCVDAGITYKDLAKAINEGVGAVKSWVYGERRINFDQACKVCNYFGKSLDELRLDERKPVA